MRWPTKQHKASWQQEGMWWLSPEIGAGIRYARHSECDVWQWGTDVQRTPQSINHDHKRLLQRRCCCDKCLLSWHLLAALLRSCQLRTTIHQRALQNQQFSSIEYCICETYRTARAQKRQPRKKIEEFVVNECGVQLSCVIFFFFGKLNITVHQRNL